MNKLIYLLFGFTISLAGYAEDYSKGLPIIPGEHVSVGNHRLHHRCIGTGSPTIVIDNGIAGSATEWYGIQNRLADKYRTCVYDRAGYGWSEPGPSPRTTEQIADELRALLNAKAERPPYIFIGHSFGGFTAMRMAAIMPQQVMGIILVDSSSPEVLFNRNEGDRKLLNPIAAGAATGKDNVPSTPQEMARFLNSRRRAIFVQMDEISNFQLSASLVGELIGLENLPMLVLARDPEVGDKNEVRESSWRRAQIGLSNISTLGQLHLAEGSDHFIHLRKPDWLAAEIEEFAARLVE